MDSRSYKSDALRDLPIRILLRSTTQILLQTLQIPLELGQRDQSRLCRPLMGLHRISAQGRFALQGVRENSDNSIAQPKSKETGDIRQNLSGQQNQNLMDETAANLR